MFAFDQSKKRALLKPNKLKFTIISIAIHMICKTMYSHSSVASH